MDTLLNARSADQEQMKAWRILAVSRQVRTASARPTVLSISARKHSFVGGSTRTEQRGIVSAE